MLPSGYENLQYHLLLRLLDLHILCYAVTICASLILSGKPAQSLSLEGISDSGTVLCDSVSANYYITFAFHAHLWFWVCFDGM